MQHLVDQDGAIANREGGTARRQLVERRPQGVDVGPRVTAAGEPLRRHVAQGPQQVAGVGQRLGVGRVMRQAEVGDPDDAPLVQQDVRRLDVAVDDPLAVRVGEGLSGLEADPRHLAEVDRGACAGLVRRPAVPQRLVEPAPADVLHDVEVPPVVLAHPVDRDDIGVVQPAGGLGLAAEPRQVGRLAEQLQGHVPVERPLVRLVDDPHPAATDLADDAEVPNVLLRPGDRRGEGHGRPPPDAACLAGSGRSPRPETPHARCTMGRPRDARPRRPARSRRGRPG